MWDQWVLDATLSDGGPDLFCFCPLEGDPEGEFEVITGMNFASDAPPGRLVGIVHEDGAEAVEAWCRAHSGLHRRLPLSAAMEGAPPCAGPRVSVVRSLRRQARTGRGVHRMRESLSQQSSRPPTMYVCPVCGTWDQDEHYTGGHDWDVDPECHRNQRVPVQVVVAESLLTEDIVEAAADALATRLVDPSFGPTHFQLKMRERDRARTAIEAALAAVTGEQEL